MKRMAVMLVILLATSGCVIGAAPPPEPPVELLEICSNEDFNEFIITYPGSDQELLDILQGYCMEFVSDSHGCEASMDMSTFNMVRQPDGSLAVWAECKSVCEYDENGLPKNGYLLFNTMFIAGEPRFIPGTSLAGELALRPECGITATVAQIQGLQRWEA